MGIIQCCIGSLHNINQDKYYRTIPMLSYDQWSYEYIFVEQLIAKNKNNSQK
jgi:hypothetical protein